MPSNREPEIGRGRMTAGVGRRVDRSGNISNVRVGVDGFGVHEVANWCDSTVLGDIQRDADVRSAAMRPDDAVGDAIWARPPPLLSVGRPGRLGAVLGRAEARVICITTRHLPVPRFRRPQ